VCFAEQRLADQTDTRALCQRFNGGRNPAPPAPMIKTSCLYVS
jgi:hypothetical protein